MIKQFFCHSLVWGIEIQAFCRLLLRVPSYIVTQLDKRVFVSLQALFSEEIEVCRVASIPSSWSYWAIWRAPAFSGQCPLQEPDLRRPHSWAWKWLHFLQLVLEFFMNLKLRETVVWERMLGPVENVKVMASIWGALFSCYVWNTC